MDTQCTDRGTSKNWSTEKHPLRSSIDRFQNPYSGVIIAIKTSFSGTGIDDIGIAGSECERTD
jgi:hypothetical protein